MSIRKTGHTRGGHVYQRIKINRATLVEKFCAKLFFPNQPSNAC